MAPKIFLTGVTGYVGGDAFYAIHEAHPGYEYSLLVRNEERGKVVTDKYPNVRLVYGGLDDAEVLEKEAAAADIVVHTADASDHVPAAKAIAKGLAAGHSADKPGYWIHICGTAILCWYDLDNKRSGEGPIPEQTYDDIADIDRITSLPDSAPHRDVDKIVLASNSEDGIKTSIVAPPTIYGPGRGPGNTRSRQVPDMAKFTLEKGYAPIIGTGKTEWDNVHIHDLGKYFTMMVDAVTDESKNQNPEIFGPRAYYFLENGVHVWGEVAKLLAQTATDLGYLPEPLTKSVTLKEIEFAGVGNNFWEVNSKSVAKRAAKYLGWAPKGASLKETMADLVTDEAKALGLEPKEKK